MVIAADQVMAFADLFKGRQNAYGESILGASGPGPKIPSKNRTVDGTPTPDVYQAHLEGKKGLGIVPITEIDTCYFGVIDIDRYGGEADDTVRAAYATGLPFCPFKSKSGGVHLYLFFKEAVAAGDLIKLLRTIRDILGLPEKTEIFPKQAVSGKVGNWINLPLYGVKTRTLITQDGKDLSFDATLSYAKQHKTTLKGIKAALSDIAFSDGPPCLQTLALYGVTENRNNFLFSVGRYYKAKLGTEQLEQALTDFNASLPSPLPDKEVRDTIASLTKGDYSYKCSDVPICDRCNKVVCKSREFGIGGSQVSELNFGKFRQYKADPPFYEWEINGKPLRFYKISDITQQSAFIDKCTEIVHFMPARLKNQAWAEIVNNAMREDNLEVIEPPKTAEISTGTIFLGYLAEFVEDRVKARNPSQILMNRVWYDADLEAYIFLPRCLLDFILQRKQFRVFSAQEIGTRLQDLGGSAIKYRVSDGNPNMVVWQLPKKSLAEFIIDKTDAYTTPQIEKEENSETHF